MEKYKDKYRIPSNRKPEWDYSSDGQYFITLVIQHRHCVLGHITEGTMILNPWGEIILHELLQSFNIRTELRCDNYVIMPNHIHIIITINQSASQTTDIADKLPNVETHGRASFSNPSPDQQKTFHRQPKSLSSFIAGYKSAINTAIDNAIDNGYNLFPHLGKFNKNNHFFQSNYHDHIIRNQLEYQHINEYIDNNPQKWDDDSLKNPLF